MQTVPAPRGDARTFLTHFVRGGPDHDRYVIQPSISKANGDIVPVYIDDPRRKARRTIIALKTVERYGRRATRSSSNPWSAPRIVSSLPSGAP